MKKCGFLIDMDGILFIGGQTLPGGKEFIKYLMAHSYPFLFLTNGSKLNPVDYKFKLNQLGIDVTVDNFYTSAMATAHFIASQKPHGSAYVLGEGGLLQSLHENNIAINEKNPDFVIIGDTRNYNVEMLEKGINFILEGAKLISTNIDPVPYELKWAKPTNKAITALFEVATGRTAFITGKPSPIMMRYARKALNLRTEETIMIGDTMETDILGGIYLNYFTILCLSGMTKQEDLAKYAYQPHAIVSSIADIIPMIEKDKLNNSQLFVK